MTETLQVYRQSALKDSDCLHRFKAIWKDGVTDESDYAVFGQAFHHVAYLYIQRLVQKGVPSDAEEASVAFVEGVATHRTPNRLIPELRELWFRFAEVFTLNLERFVAAEHRMTWNGISAGLDLVYAHPEGLEIIDFKTFWQPLTEEEARGSFQARVYSLLAQQHFPRFPAYRFTFAFVRFNRAVSVVFSQADLDHVLLEAQAAMARIAEAERTNEWPAAVGPLCRYCALQCPIADQTMTIPVRFVSAPMAKDVAQWLVAAERTMAGVKKALKAYATANGPIEVGGGLMWANRPTTARKYPVHRVMETLQARNAAGAFESDDLTVSHSALSGLFRKFPALLDDLKPFVQEKVSYRFGLGADPNDPQESED
jgi:hypothetical protein